MSIWSVLKGTKLIDNVTNIVDKAVTDKDKKNELVFAIMNMFMQSQVAKWVRAILAIEITTGVLFFGHKLTIPPDKQHWALGAVLGYYFMDRLLAHYKK